MSVILTLEVDSCGCCGPMCPADEVDTINLLVSGVNITGEGCTVHAGPRSVKLDFTVDGSYTLNRDVTGYFLATVVVGSVTTYGFGDDSCAGTSIGQYPVTCPVAAYISARCGGLHATWTVNIEVKDTTSSCYGWFGTGTAFDGNGPKTGIPNTSTCGSLTSGCGTGGVATLSW
jgi:hypothetical protein